MNTGKNTLVILSYFILSKMGLNETSMKYLPTLLQQFSSFKKEMSNINSEIQKIKSKNVIVNTDKTGMDYISGVFTRGKKDGSHRMILNLKSFKM